MSDAEIEERERESETPENSVAIRFVEDQLRCLRKVPNPSPRRRYRTQRRIAKLEARQGFLSGELVKIALGINS